MRKIEKSIRKAKAYFNWVENTLTDSHHPDYNSTKNEFYYDILYNLLVCQKGVCAYTEMIICDPQCYCDDYWDITNGKYIGDINSEFLKVDGSLDHFDSSLKKNKNGWKWENFFAIQFRLNNYKLKKKVNPIFKPDNIGYDPFLYLDYVITEHMFKPKDDLPIGITSEMVWEMIGNLGLNLGFVKIRRQMCLERNYDYVKYNIKSLEEVKEELKEFFTSFDIYYEKVLN